MVPVCYINVPRKFAAWRQFIVSPSCREGNVIYGGRVVFQERKEGVVTVHRGNLRAAQSGVLQLHVQQISSNDKSDVIMDIDWTLTHRLTDKLTNTDN